MIDLTQCKYIYQRCRKLYRALESYSGAVMIIKALLHDENYILYSMGAAAPGRKFSRYLALKFHEAARLRWAYA